jgi:RNA polymerase sigma factor (sigma-70 family)
VAFDLTGTAWSAAQLTGCDAKTVARYVAVRDAGGDPLARTSRPRLIDVFMPKLEELVDRSKGKIRADVAHRKITAMGYQYELADAHAEDVGQAVWLHLAEHLNSLRDPAAVPGWLATTTQQECHRILRATRSLPADGQELQNMPGDQIATAEHELLAAQRHAPLREAFARLPPARQRLLAMLISDPAVPYAEISAKLGIPLGSIGPDRRRYLDRLRRDPAIARLTSTRRAAHGQASVPACTPSRAGRSRRPRSAGNRGDAGPTCPG